MIKSAQHVMDKINKTWPAMRRIGTNGGNIWMPDRSYYLPEKSEVESIAKKTYFEKYAWTKEIFDCDDFATIFLAWAKQQRYCGEHTHSIAFFMCAGTKFDGKNTGHAINGAVCQEGVYLIEPQNDKIWLADPDRDHVHFMFF